MSVDDTRRFREDDIGYKDPSKLNETVKGKKLTHEAGIRAYDRSKMNLIVRFFADLLHRTVDYTDEQGKKIALGRRSLEAFMVRNSIIKSRSEFDPETAEGLLKNFLETKHSLDRAQADIHFEKGMLVLSGQKPSELNSKLSESNEMTHEAYNALHSEVPDLPVEMIQTVFSFLGDKALAHAAHTTSKTTEKQIYSDRSLEKRILLAEARNVADTIENFNDKIKIQMEIAAAQAKNGDIKGAMPAFTSALATA